MLLKWHSRTSLKPGSDIKGVPASLTIPILIPERSLRIIYGLFLEAYLQTQCLYSQRHRPVKPSL